MKILHVGSTDSAGGASRASYRLHKGLEESGVDSKMLVRRKSSNDPKVSVSGDFSVFQNILEKLTPPIERALRRWSGNPTGSMWTFGIIPSQLAAIINSTDADLVHLHWAGNGFLPVKTLSQIRKPLVWTLHDLWPILGVGHYDDAVPELNPGWLSVDWESRVGSLKKKYWGNLGITAVGPSPWVVEQLSKMNNRPGWATAVIPYGLDTSVFEPRTNLRLREELGISQDRAVLIFGALGATSDSRKGGDLLEGVLEELAHRNFEGDIIVFGDQDSAKIRSYGFRLIRLGSVCDDTRLAEIYSLGDVFLFPSREETFGQTASEALACGIPVVGFRAAGQASVFRHKEHGYQATPFSVSDMANGVEWIISEKRRGRLWQAECREFALKEYSLARYASRHYDLYEKVIRSSRA
jgi:glycosyltransferase involved in cell wall biosynthesis